jgi:uncharacterized membrane protein
MLERDAAKASEYFGSHLRPSDVSTAMVHLYRAEITRANSWRSRLDVTTNWALLSTGAAVSVAFSQQGTHHSVIILNTLLITLFLSIEARRYRYYELWSYRVRLMETDFYAALLVPPFSPDPELADKLSESLLNPQFPISSWEALGRRLRRNYIWVYLALLVAWLAKLLLAPDSLNSLDQLVGRARMGIAPGWLVMTVVILFYLGLVAIAILTRDLRQSAGEVFPRYGESKPAAQKPAPAVDPQMQASAQTPKTYPFLGIVTADQLDAIAAEIQAQFKRAANKLDPNNTTGTQATLLLPVLITEIAALKTLVKQIDANGVVTVIPANEVFQQSATIQKAVE